MSLNDPIADALTRIRNAQRAGHETVSVNTNTVVKAILDILKKEGFVNSIKHDKDGAANVARIDLKYWQGEPAIRGIERVSTPGRRRYQKFKEIRPFLNSVGLGIFSTPKGIVSDKEALAQHVGGEYLCRVW